MSLEENISQDENLPYESIHIEYKVGSETPNGDDIYNSFNEWMDKGAYQRSEIINNIKNAGIPRLKEDTISVRITPVKNTTGNPYKSM